MQQLRIWWKSLLTHAFEIQDCESVCMCVCACMHMCKLFIFILGHKYESTSYILISCPLCPLPRPSRGHLSLQGLWDLVSEREEPTGPSDVLLQRATERTRDGRGGERYRYPPDPKHLPVSTVQQELLRGQGLGNAPEYFTQR